MVDLLGAHVSTAGGISNAPTRGAEIGATAIQVFTKSLGGFVAEWDFARTLAIYMPRDTIW